MIAYLKIILRSFLFRKRRTLLTVLGITIGSTLILTLVLLGEGLKSALTAQLNAFGSDLIIITPGKANNPIAAFAGGGEIKDKDVRIIQQVPGVGVVLADQVKDFQIEYRGEKKVVNVSGSQWAETRTVFEGSQGFGMAQGDWPTSDAQNVAVLGSLVADGRFSEAIRPGDEVTISGQRFLVAGVFKSLGNSEDDSRVYISQDRFRALTGERSGSNYVLAKIEKGIDPKRVADDISYDLSRKDPAADFTVITSDSALKTVGDVLGIVQLVLAAFASVALVVGGVNIMNTMFTSVLERTREIGIMKALGATDGNILGLFLGEAGLLGAFGGLIGIIISYLFARGIEFAAAQRGLSILKIDFNPVIVLETLLFTFVIGAVFGALPAWRASRLRPSEALRYE